MGKRIFLLKIGYWLGAIIDAYVSVQMIITYFFNSNIETLKNTDYLTKFMGVSIGLMIGWTVLLIWAERKPVERKEVALITLFPISLNVINNIYRIVNGIATIDCSIILELIVGPLLFIIFAAGYILNTVNKIDISQK